MSVLRTKFRGIRAHLIGPDHVELTMDRPMGILIDQAVKRFCKLH